LKEVSENPIVNAKRRAKIYFDYFDITLSEGESIDGRSVYALNYIHIKQGYVKKYILKENQIPLPLLQNSISDM